MAEDVAALGLKITQQGVRQATADLKTFRETAAQADEATKTFSATAQEAEAPLKTMAEAINAPRDNVINFTEAVARNTSGMALNRIQTLESMHILREFGTAAAMGVSPLQALGMEFGRIMTLFQMGDQGAGGTLRALSSGFLSILGPEATIAVGVATTAAAAWAALASQADPVKKLADSTKTLADATKTYRDAAVAASAPLSKLTQLYGDNAAQVRDLLMVQQDLARMNAQKAFSDEMVTLTATTSEIRSSLNAIALARSELARGVPSSSAAGMADTQQIASQLRLIYNLYGLNEGQARKLADAVQTAAMAEGGIGDKRAALQGVLQVFHDINQQTGALSDTFVKLEGNIVQALVQMLAFKGAEQTANPSASSMDGAARAAMNAPYAIQPLHTYVSGGTSTHHATTGIKKLSDAQKAYAQVVRDATGNLGEYQLMLSQVGVAQMNGAITAAQAGRETAMLQQRIMESTDAGKFYVQTLQSFESSMARAIVTGGSLSSVLSNLAEAFAQAAFQAALFGTGPLAQGNSGSSDSGGSSLFGGLIGSALSWLTHLNAPAASTGATAEHLGTHATGTSYAQGGWALVGENGPERVQLPRAAKVFSTGVNPSGARAAPSARTDIGVHVFMDESGAWQTRVQQIAGSVMATGIAAYDSTTLPASMARISNDPRARG